LRDQFEKALVLLQKTEGVLEVVNLETSSRDKYIAFITYNNIAMCFQKLSMLDECTQYLKQCLEMFKNDQFMPATCLAQRNRRLKLECKLRLQLCAILSQTQNHTEALARAKESVRLVQILFIDLMELCKIYIDKINYKENLQAANEQSDLDDDERAQIVQMILSSTPTRELPKHFLEQSISLVERSSLKLYPVVKEVCKRLAGQEPEKLNEPRADSAAQSQDEDEDMEPDMRSVLGFLNQNEWIQNLNIGNIMQISSLSM
jgi:tetratricopeptide (TPR) repeat protein